MELLQEKGKMKLCASDEVSVHSKGPKIPAFEDVKNDMDSYLRRFEIHRDAGIAKVGVGNTLKHTFKR